jgi:hypothetical protein
MGMSQTVVIKGKLFKVRRKAQSLMVFVELFGTSVVISSNIF